MSLLQAIVLGIVQGLTEFLPVSSSGHLILVPYLFGWDPQELTFDVALHVGTFLAVLLYFRRDWLQMIGSGLADARDGRILRGARPETHLLLLVALGSLPAAIVGIAASQAEDELRRPLVVATMLVLVAGIMWVADRQLRTRHDMSRVNTTDAVVTGLAQATALVPGVSRSGITISAGLFRGLDRETATRFSFLLAMPAVFGAALFSFGEALLDSQDENFEWGAFVAGATTAAVVGFVTIHYFLRYLRFNSLRPFVWYRLGLAAVVLIVAAVR